MTKEAEKPVKVFLCCVLGLLLAALLGHPNSITVAASALLVVGTGQNTSQRGIRLYMARRLTVQLLGTALLMLPLLLLRRLLSLPDWATVLLALLVPLGVFFYLDYRVRLSPMYITTAGISTLILATGTVQSPGYPLTRILLVAAGCLLGYVLSVFVLPRDHAADAAGGLDRAFALLEDCAKAGQAGDTKEMGRLLAQTDGLLQSVRASLSALADQDGDRAALMEVWLDSQRSLSHVLGRWLRRMDAFRALPPEDRARWLDRLDQTLDCHRALAGLLSGRAEGEAADVRRLYAAEELEAGLLGELVPRVTSE